MPLTGGCQCGNIKYAVDGDPVGNALCYSASCRHSTGSANTASFLVLKRLFKSSGTPKVYTRKSSSGADVQNSSCGDCGSPLWVNAASLDESGLIIIRPVTLSDLILNETFKPQMEIYCRSKYSWESDIEDAQKFETMMPHQQEIPAV
ncbi:Mss4-like protein [Macrophomina phaseolina]|uniref:Mss4-like protein n=1 Tax=Macrophomina phaseolina TaxID=35725 RepID=A0ABQ8G707_9PEZI|nr:Mss4-like protein [Macrophomina phaseolina]